MYSPDGFLGDQAREESGGTRRWEGEEHRQKSLLEGWADEFR